MKQWEYGEVVVDKSRLYETIELMDSAGKDGWEFTGHVDETMHVKMYMMKRPIESEVLIIEGDEGDITLTVPHTHSIKEKCWVNCPHRGTVNEITKRG